MDPPAFTVSISNISCLSDDISRDIRGQQENPKNIFQSLITQFQLIKKKEVSSSSSNSDFDFSKESKEEILNSRISEMNLLNLNKIDTKSEKLLELSAQKELEDISGVVDLGGRNIFEFRLWYVT